MSLPRSLAACLIVISGVIVYANSFRGVMVFDDIGAIDLNPSIRSLWPIRPVLFDATYATVTGRPLLNLSLAINYALHGMDVWGYHLVNVIFHLLAALALFGVVRRTLLLPTLGDRFGASSTNLALAIALIWVVHPLQTQSVTYIVQRGEAMVALFYLLVLYCVIRGHESPRRLLWHIAAVMSCVLGIATKEVMVTAPVVVLVYDWIFLSGSLRQVLKRKWLVYLGMIATWGMLAGLMASSANREGTAGFGLGMSWWEYARTQFGYIVHYLKLSFWPHPLVLDYGTNIAKSAGEIVPYAIIVGLLLGATIWGLMKHPKAGFLGFCFFVILSPTSSIVPLPGQVAAEHRMYLPLAAVVSLTILAFWRFSRVTGSVRMGLTLIVAVVLGTLTIRRNQDYREVLGLWQTVIAAMPENSRGYNSAGSALYQAGRDAESIEYSTRAIELEPRDFRAYFNRGMARRRMGQIELALGDFQQSIAIRPSLDAYAMSGSIRQQLGQHAAAIRDYDEAIARWPHDAQSYYNRGLVYQQTGAFATALRDYTSAIERSGSYADAYNNRGLVHQASGEVDLAVADFTRVIEIQPDYAIAYSNRGAAHLLAGRFDAAIEDCSRAIALDPQRPGAYIHRAIAYFRSNNFDQAWADVNKAQSLGGQVDPRFIRDLAQKSGRTG